MDCPQGFHRCYLPDLTDLFNMKCALSELNHSLNINFSLMEAFKILKEHQVQDQNVNHTTEMILILVYTLLIISGMSANMIISFVVARKTQMHTPRNLYIVNLTVSDMTLCVICMPFTLMAIIQRPWDLGLNLCKLVPALQGANILVSVGTITVIALDRYFTIVCGQDSQSTRKRVVTSILSLWVVSIVATFPIFYYQTLVPVKVNNIMLYEMCLEQWPSPRVKVVYTTTMLMVQAIIPAVVVGSVHMLITSHLRTHDQTQQDERRLHREIERNRRTTLLLSIVTILFALSWLPLSIFTLILDVFFNTEFFEHIDTQNLYVAFAVCHIVAMSSAISNHIVYGWLNSNIRQEFLQLFQSKCASSNVDCEAPPTAPQPPVTKMAVSVMTQTVTDPSAAQTLGGVYLNGHELSKDESFVLDTEEFLQLFQSKCASSNVDCEAPPTAPQPPVTKMAVSVMTQTVTDPSAAQTLGGVYLNGYKPSKDESFVLDTEV